MTILCDNVKTQVDDIMGSNYGVVKMEGRGRSWYRVSLMLMLGDQSGTLKKEGTQNLG